MQFVEFMIDKSKIVGILIIVGLVLYFASVKIRWQFYPLYLLAGLYFLIVLAKYFSFLTLTQNTSRVIIIVFTFLLVISIFFLLAFPMEELPKPSGKYKLGTRIYDLEDKKRDEIYSEKANAKRKIKYQIWYPADSTEGYDKEKWIHDGKILTRQLARSIHLPSFMLDHTGDIYSNSYYGAPINKSQDKYPLVIISHGWKGFRELHTDFAEDLASHGFIAISIDHTYGSQAVKFKDGRISYLNKDALPKETDPDQYRKNANALITSYAGDVISLLDKIERLNSDDSNFKNKLDLEKIGLLGHSTGGGGDVYAAIEDSRIKALLGLDVWVNPIDSNILKKGLTIPSLFLRSDQWSEGPNNRALDEVINNSDSTSLIEMGETNHIDLTMAYMYSPLAKYIGMAGKEGGRKSSEIQREFIINFFKESLKKEKKNRNLYLKEIIDKYDNLKLID